MILPVVIRKAQRADAQDVRAVRDAAILTECAGHYQASLLSEWTTGPIDDGFIDDVEARFYVASIGDRIVATGKIDLESGRIDAMFVIPDCMRFGISRAMITHLRTTCDCCWPFATDFGFHSERGSILPPLWLCRQNSQQIPLPPWHIVRLHSDDERACPTRYSFLRVSSGSLF